MELTLELSLMSPCSQFTPSPHHLIAVLTLILYGNYTLLAFDLAPITPFHFWVFSLHSGFRFSDYCSHSKSWSMGKSNHRTL